MAEYKNDDIHDKIKKCVNVPVPDSLKPENIEKMLDARTADSGSKNKETNYKTKSSKRRYKVIYGGIAVAAAAAIGTTVWLSGLMPAIRDEINGGLENKKNKETMVAIDAQTDVQENDVLAVTAGLTQAIDYEQVREILYRYEEERYVGNTVIFDGSSFTEVEESLEVYESTSQSKGETSGANTDVGLGMGSGEDAADYSQTNVQEEGVAEADKTITDGEYIYELSGKYDYDDTSTKISIIKPDKATGELVLLSQIDLQDAGYNNYYDYEMYVHEDWLVVIHNEADTSGQVAVVTYNIADRANPFETGRVEVEGYYADSRLVNGYLYLFVEYNYNHICFSEEEFSAKERYIPCIQGAEIACEDIYIPEIDKASGYLLGVSVELKNPAKTKDQFAVLTNSNEFYISQNNIYTIENDYTGQTSSVINKISYKDGLMEPMASGRVEGIINNSFSMDEYNGYLRMVTTSEYTQESTMEEYTTRSSRIALNHLFVLDSNLQITGEINNLAPDEEIYSARFMGDTGFFVTYRQMDPLFSVDLSDPFNPVILGELKISGFSEYLHPYGNNRLLGIGWETTYHEDEDWTETNGMKLSMFDTTDMGNVRESSKSVFEEVCEMPAGNNHKAVLVNAEKNLFGFAVITRIGRKCECYYTTYRYVEGKGFEEVTRTLLPKDDEYMDVSDVRGVYIGDILYIGTRDRILSVSLTDGTVLDQLELF